MMPKTATRKDAAQTSGSAGATPPFDAPCVTVAVGSLPPHPNLAASFLAFSSWGISAAFYKFASPPR